MHFGRFGIAKFMNFQSSEPSRQFHRGYPYSFREPAPTRSTILGFDVSRVLLFSLISLFGFLLIAYLATANSGALIHGGRIAYSECFFFIYFTVHTKTAVVSYHT